MIGTGLRQSYLECRELLTRRLAEPAPGRIQLLAGPRQVGKTTLLCPKVEGQGRGSLSFEELRREAGRLGIDWDETITNKAPVPAEIDLPQQGKHLRPPARRR